MKATDMKERPILFTGAMARALLDGSKTQTRRAVKPAHLKFFDQSAADSLGAWNARPLPYGKPADRLWVRETFQHRGASYDGLGLEDSEWFRCYGHGAVAADSWDPEFPDGWQPSRHMNVRKLTEPAEQQGDGITGWVTKFIPSIHMPRWASRITLEITAVRVERLQDISEADAISEGCAPNYLPNRAYQYDPYKSGYVSLWQGINGHGSWRANPWVWVIEFKVLQK